MMEKPDINLFDLLISLYADQEGVKITYELEDKKDVRCMPKVAV
jgi:hypothetical protein